MPTILVVEDDENNLDMISRRLKRHGFAVATARDGAEGITKALSERPDLILMDMWMPPGMDGYEASRRLKESEQTRAIPIIGLSAYIMPGDREKALAAGCDEYEGKPIDLPQLLAKMGRLLPPEGASP